MVYVRRETFDLFIYYTLCSVGVHTASELEAMQERMEYSQLKTYNLTESDLVKDHLRYLVIIFFFYDLHFTKK